MSHHLSSIRRVTLAAALLLGLFVEPSRAQFAGPDNSNLAPAAPYSSAAQPSVVPVLAYGAQAQTAVGPVQALAPATPQNAMPQQANGWTTPPSMKPLQANGQGLEARPMAAGSAPAMPPLPYPYFQPQGPIIVYLPPGALPTSVQAWPGGWQNYTPVQPTEPWPVSSKNAEVQKRSGGLLPWPTEVMAKPTDARNPAVARQVQYSGMPANMPAGPPVTPVPAAVGPGMAGPTVAPPAVAPPGSAAPPAAAPSQVARRGRGLFARPKWAGPAPNLDPVTDEPVNKAIELPAVLGLSKGSKGLFPKPAWSGAAESQIPSSAVVVQPKDSGPSTELTQAMATKSASPAQSVVPENAGVNSQKLITLPTVVKARPAGAPAETLDPIAQNPRAGASDRLGLPSARRQKGEMAVENHAKAAPATAPSPRRPPTDESTLADRTPSRPQWKPTTTRANKSTPTATASPLEHPKFADAAPIKKLTPPGEDAGAETRATAPEPRQARQARTIETHDVAAKDNWAPTSTLRPARSRLNDSGANRSVDSAMARNQVKTSIDKSAKPAPRSADAELRPNPVRETEELVETTVRNPLR